MSCRLSRTPSEAILLIASTFIVGGMAPAINEDGKLLYKTAGGGCAAYLVASDEMKKIMSQTDHGQHNVCGLRTDLDVRLHEMIDKNDWEASHKEEFVQSLQDAHDRAAVSYKSLLDSKVSKDEAKKVFNLIFRANLEYTAQKFGVKVEWPESVEKIVHEINNGRPPSTGRKVNQTKKDETQKV